MDQLLPRPLFCCEVAVGGVIHLNVLLSQIHIQGWGGATCAGEGFDIGLSGGALFVDMVVPCLRDELGISPGFTGSLGPGRRQRS